MDLCAHAAQTIQELSALVKQQPNPIAPELIQIDELTQQKQRIPYLLV